MCFKYFECRYARNINLENLGTCGEQKICCLICKLGNLGVIFLKNVSVKFQETRREEHSNYIMVDCI